MNPVQTHYQSYPYPRYPLIASVHRPDTYALNMDALWARFNRMLPPPEAKSILISGCGTFAPYPWAVSNPDVPIVALDLSERSLRRARCHCLLHGCRNVVYRCGDLVNGGLGREKFGLIDSYGVLHHLNDPLQGLKTLAKHLVPGGILRVMFYSRYARRQEESIRRAFRLIGVCTPKAARQLFRRTRPGSRLASYLSFADEATTDEGIADALLHPCVHTYRIDELLDMLSEADLAPLMFAHSGALADVGEEIERLRFLEMDRRSPGNFIIYLGSQPLNRNDHGFGNAMLVLNPCLVSAVSRLRVGEIVVSDRIGCGATTLTRHDRCFLRRFLIPVQADSLLGDVAEVIDVYKRRLILLEYRR